jgi:hypothetical protein
MAQSSFTPILIYASGTATNVPLAANLTSSANGAELALNYADGKLYYKNSAGAVTLLAGVGAAVSTISFGSTGLTPATATSGAVTVAGTLAIANGGTGQTTASTAFNALSPITTAGDLILGNGTNSATRLAIGASTYVLTSNGTTASWSAPSSGTVTAVSVVSANGFAGTSSGGATPALTLSTTITGVLKGNATAISAATAGTDYVAPATATTFTALQTFNGTSALGALKTININEPATVSATASTGTINFDITTQSVLYYTTNASGNFTLNFRASSGTSLNTLMATGDSICVSFLCTNGATAYYNSAVTVDGNSVTPKYQGGTAWTSGNASSIDAYNFVIVKTGSAAFTILTSQTKFA